MGSKVTEAINSLTVQFLRRLVSLFHWFPPDFGSFFHETLYGNANTETRIASDTADNILWSRFASPKASNSPLTPQAQAALCRVTFANDSSSSPLRAVIQRAALEFKAAADEYKSLLLVVGRARRLAVESHHAELHSIIAEQPHSSIGGDVTRAIGGVAAGFVASATNASVLVMQAAHSSSS